MTLECEHCAQQFMETEDGLTVLMWHTLVLHGDIVDRPAETRVDTDPYSHEIRRVVLQ